MDDEELLELVELETREMPLSQRKQSAGECVFLLKAPFLGWF